MLNAGDQAQAQHALEKPAIGNIFSNIYSNV